MRVWKEGVWYTTNEDLLEKFMSTSDLNDTIGHSMIQHFGGVEQIRFRVELQPTGMVRNIISVIDKVVENVFDTRMSNVFTKDEVLFFVEDGEVAQEELTDEEKERISSVKAVDLWRKLEYIFKHGNMSFGGYAMLSSMEDFVYFIDGEVEDTEKRLEERRQEDLKEIESLEKRISALKERVNNTKFEPFK